MDRIFIPYLQTHRRLVVPQLGAFIRRQEGDEVVFSELLRRDDGVLRGLLVAQRGMSDLEAAGAVDRFVFEVRLALQQGRPYRISGLGRFEADADGRLLFRYEPALRTPPEAGLPLERASVDPMKKLGPKPLQERQTLSKPVAGRTAAGKSMPSEAAPHVSVSPKCRPEPYVKGLQYGKPLRTTDAYTYVNRRPPRRLDKFVMLAIAVALVALAAILYGYMRERRVEQQERHYLEQLAPGETASEGTDANIPLSGP